MIRCYECAHYTPKTQTRGYCQDIKKKVDAVDFCEEGKKKNE